jgi:small subunit ribosomal protein S6
LRDYELVFIVNPEVGDEGVQETVDRVHNFIQERGGEVKESENWGKRRLAYPIKRQAEGVYVVSQIAFEPQELRALEGNLDLAEDVLRHLVTRAEEVKQAQEGV